MAAGRSHFGSIRHTDSVRVVLGRGCCRAVGFHDNRHDLWRLHQQRHACGESNSGCGRCERFARGWRSHSAIRRAPDFTGQNQIGRANGRLWRGHCHAKSSNAERLPRLTSI